MDNDYYKILGVTKDSDSLEIKQAYHRLALQYHPDKNKAIDSAEQFKKIVEAFEVLSDPIKRSIYDVFGREGLRSHESSASTSQSGYQPNERKDSGTSAFHCKFDADPMGIFEELFAATDTFDLLFSTGSPRMSNMGTSFTFGPGLNETNKRHAKPNVFRHGHTYGRTARDQPITKELFVSLEEISSGCTRQVEISSGEVLTVNVQPGCEDGAQVVFKRGDSQPSGVRPADIVVVIRHRPHALFTRDGANLCLIHRVGLRSALCGPAGGCVNVATLGGGTAALRLAEGEVITPHTNKVLPGAGLPLMGEPAARGHLLVSFEVVFPDRLTDAQKEILRDVLPH